MSALLSRGLFVAALSTCLLPQARASTFNNIAALDQAEFKTLCIELGAAVAYRGLVSAEPLGTAGFELGLSAGAAELSHTDVLSKATGGDKVPRGLPLLGLHLVKGLPWNLDLGVLAQRAPDTNLLATGGELRWAFMPGDAVWPTVALRLSTMNVEDIDQLRLRSQGADIVVSKGFGIVTPYAGFGRMRVTGKAPGTTLARESVGMYKSHAGLSFALAPAALVLEFDKTGHTQSYGIKLAARW